MCVSAPGGSRLGWTCKAGGSEFDSSRKRNWVQISIYAFGGVLYRVRGWCKPLQSGIRERRFVKQQTYKSILLFSLASFLSPRA